MRRSFLLLHTGSWAGVLAIVRDDQTVFLDGSGRIRLRVPGRRLNHRR